MTWDVKWKETENGGGGGTKDRGDRGAGRPLEKEG